jgi:hypothetical protein
MQPQAATSEKEENFLITWTTTNFSRTFPWSWLLASTIPYHVV